MTIIINYFCIIDVEGNIMNENEYVIAYTWRGQRRYEHIFARNPEEAKDLFRGRHTERIESVALAKYSTHKL